MVVKPTAFGGKASLDALPKSGVALERRSVGVGSPSKARVEVDGDPPKGQDGWTAKGRDGEGAGRLDAYRR